MRGTMMDFPLTLVPILERAGKLFNGIEIVSRRPDRSIARCTYGDIYRRSRRLARALELAGIGRGERVATLMWNHAMHLECYFGIPLAGGVIHTLNLRLHPNELAYTANHARDRFLIVDDVLLPVYETFRSQVNFERVFVAPFGCTAMPREFERYEDLLAAADDDFEYPQFEENEAALACFTSGTTGKAKGVVYSHRAIVLHSFASCIAGTFGVSHDDVILVCPSMFHANGWGLPWTATMMGAKLALPGPNMDAESLLDLIEREGVTLASGVPTLWLSVLQAFENNPGRWKIKKPLRIVSGGSAVPEALFRGFDRYGVQVRQIWGMTETTPMASMGTIKSTLAGCSEEDAYKIRTKAGLPSPFVEMRVMTSEGEAPWDDESVGELEVRGPWVTASYLDAPETSDRWSKDGWFRTGDMASIDPEGYIRIVDRSKDMIKSGGEWISSVDLENALMNHPAVSEAAVIGVPHPKWQERPLAVVVIKQGIEVQEEELRAFLADKFAKWQLPDAFIFATEIPRTSVGKFLKTKLRKDYADWKWK
jgi:fatty-acyl-CoA synthase